MESRSRSPGRTAKKEVVGDAGSLVDDEQGDGGEAADGGLLAGECDEAGAVGKEEGAGAKGAAAGGNAKAVEWSRGQR